VPPYLQLPLPGFGAEPFLVRPPPPRRRRGNRVWSDPDVARSRSEQAAAYVESRQGLMEVLASRSPEEREELRERIGGKPPVPEWLRKEQPSEATAEREQTRPHG
jgi:hypothetical protein